MPGGTVARRLVSRRAALAYLASIWAADQARPGCRC